MQEIRVKIEENKKTLQKLLKNKDNQIPTYYDIAILIFALDNLTGCFKKLNKKNPKIAFCCDYIEMIAILDSDKSMKKRLLYLKNFD